MWDLSYPTKDWTCAPCIGSAVLTTGPPLFLFLPSHWSCHGAPPSGPHLNLITCKLGANYLKVRCKLGANPHLQIPLHWGAGLQPMNFGEAEKLSVTLDRNKRSALNKKFSSLKISIHMLGYPKTSKRSKTWLKFICGFFGENDVCFQKSAWSQTNQTFLWTEFLPGTYLCNKDSDHNRSIMSFSCLILLQFFL